ncbi:MAG: hypothetical protein RLZZ245_3517 [Verrucomicrobiota bacterium]|jgi:formylglycine-generating enzyme required for sulfatase activity
MIDDAFLRQVAALQANLKMLESQQDALSDFQDMQALRLYKARLVDYIEAHARAGQLPRDPFQAIEQRLIALSEFFAAADQEFQRLKGWKADWLNSVPAVSLADLQSARTELAEQIAEVPHIQERFTQRLSPLDWDTSSATADLHADLMACAMCVSGLKIPQKPARRIELYQFTRGVGDLAKKTSSHFTTLGLRIEELIAFHADHVKAVAKTQQHLSNHDFRSAQKVVEGLAGHRFLDIDFKKLEAGRKKLEAVLAQFVSLDVLLDQRLKETNYKSVIAELECLNGLIEKPDSELGRECLAIAEQIELKIPRFLPNMSQGFIRSLALHCSSLFSDRAKSEFNRLERLAEANAKAEREVMAKLTAEIGAGRVGASVGVLLSGKAVMQFAYCPAGSFLMGSPSSEVGRGRDENQVRVTLSKSFWLAKTEVTQSQWKAVMGDNPSDFKGYDLPVENVIWDDAQAFIKKVNDSGVMPAGWEMALPTEAQWEYACRARDTGPHSGGSIDQVAWYNGNSASKTHDVGTKKANAWGLHDMHGNVWEWCADWYDDTLPRGADPSGPSSGFLRVRRGGSWRGTAAFCRAAFRGRGNPDRRDNRLGFRPALVPSK